MDKSSNTHFLYTMGGRYTEYQMVRSIVWQGWFLGHLPCVRPLYNFYKAIYKLSALSIPSYFAPSQRLTRHFHPLHYIIPSTRTTVTSHQQSYFPRSIKDWNELPIYIIESNNLQSFTTLLINHYNYNHA